MNRIARILHIAESLRIADQLISIFDIVDEETLNDPQEYIYDLIDPEEEKNIKYKVQTISAKQAKKQFKTMQEDMTVFESYTNHAHKDQKEIVKDKMRSFDSDRIIVTSNNKVVDGNHHLIAAIKMNKPIKYINLQDPITTESKNKEETTEYHTRLHDIQNKLRTIASTTMKVYRGEFSGNKDGKYWSTDKEWAAQFTQTGRIEEVKTRRIKESDIFSIDPLPYAGDPDAIDEVVNQAKENGFKAIRLNEGTNEPNSIYVFDNSALRIASKSSCPIHNKMYGGLPEGGNYTNATEYEIGAQRFAEAAHCILGSIFKASRDFDNLLNIEIGHLKEEIGIMKYVLEEYSRDIYTDRVWNHYPEKYKEKTIKSIRDNSPKLKTKAQQLASEVEHQNLPSKVSEIVTLTYDAVIQLADSLLKSIKDYPQKMENAYKDPKLNQITNNISQIINELS